MANSLILKLTRIFCFFVTRSAFRRTSIRNEVLWARFTPKKRKNHVTIRQIAIFLWALIKPGTLLWKHCFLSILSHVPQFRQTRKHFCEKNLLVWILEYCTGLKILFAQYLSGISVFCAETCRQTKKLKNWMFLNFLFLLPGKRMEFPQQRF